MSQIIESHPSEEYEEDEEDGKDKEDPAVQALRILAHHNNRHVNHLATMGMYQVSEKYDQPIRLYIDPLDALDTSGDIEMGDVALVTTGGATAGTATAVSGSGSAKGSGFGGVGVSDEPMPCHSTTHLRARKGSSPRNRSLSSVLGSPRASINSILVSAGLGLHTPRASASSIPTKSFAISPTPKAKQVTPREADVAAAYCRPHGINNLELDLADLAPLIAFLDDWLMEMQENEWTYDYHDPK